MKPTIFCLTITGTLFCMFSLGQSFNQRRDDPDTAIDGHLTEYGDKSRSVIYNLVINGEINALPSLKCVELDQGSIPVGILCESTNGKLYGMTEWGGLNDLGVIYEWDPCSNRYTKKIDFDGQLNGAHPRGSLVPGQNGRLYGMTEYGGANDKGILFEWDPVTNALTKNFDFDGETGTFPFSSLVRASNNKFYGMTRMGGSSNEGTLFEWDPYSNIFTKKLDFDGITKGSGPRGSLIEADNGKLYGMTWSGGQYDKGVLFEWDFISNTYTKKVDFNDEIGCNPVGSLYQADNGKLYGATSNAGDSPNCGIIFEWDIVNNTFEIKHSFVYNEGHLNGCSPLSSFTQGENGKLYGIVRLGGPHASGLFYELDPISGEYSTKFVFNYLENGSDPNEVMKSSTGRIYVTAESGLSSETGERYETGAIFEYEPDGDEFKKVFGFNSKPDTSIHLDEGLVAYYPFNGNANDESGNQHNGIVEGATLTSDRFDNPDKAYYFSGQGSSISVEGFNIPADSTTITCWVKVLSPSGIQNFISKHNGVEDVELLIRSKGDRYAIEWTIGGVGGTYFVLKDECGLFRIDPEHPRFDFLTLVYNGKEVDFYVNNQLIASHIISGKIAASTWPLTFGRWAAIESEGFTGTLDDIRIYNRALNLSEIEALYHEKVSKNHNVIRTPDITTYKNSSFEFPVYIDSLRVDDDLYAYQFNVSFDSQKLVYQEYSATETLSEAGILEVHPEENLLSVAWAGSIPIVNTGTLLNLNFKALEKGQTAPVISNFLLNTDTTSIIKNGTITIHTEYGDVDDNNSVQAYDASVVLQYSVGMDPLQDRDPIPWENWRYVVANVDGENDITAYDASLILQKVTGLISTFSEYSVENNIISPYADVTVDLEGDTVIFRSQGDLYGLNIRAIENYRILGKPLLLNDEILSACNISDACYAVGMAFVHPPGDNEGLLKIPVTIENNESIGFDLIVNNEARQVFLESAVSINRTHIESFMVYPNPARNILYIRDASYGIRASIYDYQGALVIEGDILNNQIDVSSLKAGVYILCIWNNDFLCVKKFVKY